MNLLLFLSNFMPMGQHCLLFCGLNLLSFEVLRIFELKFGYCGGFFSILMGWVDVMVWVLVHENVYDMRNVRFGC